MNQTFSDENIASSGSLQNMKRLLPMGSDLKNMTSILTFLSGIATARFGNRILQFFKNRINKSTVLGLWMADLSIIHIMQDGVPESNRNTVFGVHNALCQTFSVLKNSVFPLRKLTQLRKVETKNPCVLERVSFRKSFVPHRRHLRSGVLQIFQHYSCSISHNILL
uniref:Solute carrier family 40 member n=1 Tax=Angiostrongylus cantonensis TaxID=6313 RepID=A0A0K0CYF2_ANGCA